MNTVKSFFPYQQLRFLISLVSTGGVAFLISSNTFTSLLSTLLTVVLDSQSLLPVLAFRDILVIMLYYLKPFFQCKKLSYVTRNVDLRPIMNILKHGIYVQKQIL